MASSKFDAFLPQLCRGSGAFRSGIFEDVSRNWSFPRKGASY